MIATTHIVDAEYVGIVDLGRACFAVNITDLKPAATVRNKVLFRSQAGEAFEIGRKYLVEAVISQESQFSPRSYEVTKASQCGSPI